MRTELFAFFALALVPTFNRQLSTLHAQGTVFTYQGRLTEGTNIATGSYDLTFTLFSAVTGPAQVGTTITNSATSVSNGLFTVALDFGANFPGAGRWLEISVRTNGGATFSTLSPRQKITPTPYAITAGNVTGVVPNGSLSGTYSSPVTLNNATNSFAGSGAGLTGVNAATLGGLGAPSFWQLLGNAGTTPGVNFLGTTDNQPLELKVNGQRAFRLEPTANSPNVIGGFAGNYVNSNAVGATIGGGGTADGRNAVGTGSIFPGGSFTTIGGGAANTIVRGDYSAIGGGRSNIIAEAQAIGFASSFCNIGGGAENSIGGALNSFIGGGFANIIHGDFIVGGTIGGGVGNSMNRSSSAPTIGGGSGNSLQDAHLATIAGGELNSITGANDATIAGGESNSIYGASYSTIGGGSGNSFFIVAPTYGVISGGQSNVVSAKYGTIPGGAQAAARNYGQMAYASGRFSTNGDAQTSWYVCRGTTTSGTQTTLFLDGVSQQMAVPNNSTWAFDILVTGRTSGGSSAGYQIRGVIEHNAGTTSIVGSPTVLVLAEDVAAWDAAVAADNANDALQVRVTGAAATNIRWVASVRAVEVTY